MTSATALANLNKTNLKPKPMKKSFAIAKQI